MSYRSKSKCIPTYIDLASLLGYREALFLAQLHYWLHKSPHWIDGNPWIYNTYQQWIEQIPLITFDKFKEISSKLRKVGIVTTTENNKDKRDRTRWYSIDYNHQILKDANLDWSAPINHKKEACEKSPTPTKTSDQACENPPNKHVSNHTPKHVSNHTPKHVSNLPSPIQYITQKNNQKNIIQISEREESFDFSLKTEINKILEEEKIEEFPISDDSVQERGKFEKSEKIEEVKNLEDSSILDDSVYEIEKSEKIEEIVENKKEDDSVTSMVRAEIEELDPSIYYTEGYCRGYELALTEGQIREIKRLHEPHPLVIEEPPKLPSPMEFAETTINNLTSDRRKELYDKFSTLEVCTGSQSYTLTQTEMNILRKHKFSPYMRREAALYTMKALERKKKKEPVDDEYGYRMRVFQDIVAGTCEKFHPEDEDTAYTNYYYRFQSGFTDSEILFYVSGM